MPSHTSTAHLREVHRAVYFRERNQTARPFKWTFRGYPLQNLAHSLNWNLPCLPYPRNITASELQRQLRARLGP